MNSATVLAGTDGLTSITFGTRMKPATGVEVAQEFEVEVLVERGVDGVGRIGEEQRVAVGRRLGRIFGGDIVAGAGLVLDDELLVQLVATATAPNSRAAMSVEPPGG